MLNGADSNAFKLLAESIIKLAKAFNKQTSRKAVQYFVNNMLPDSV